MISQYLREVKTSNYDHDDAKHALDFLTKKKTANLEAEKVDEFISDDELQEFDGNFQTIFISLFLVILFMDKLSSLEILTYQ